MTIKEMRACAAETVSYFVQTMPDAPFAEDDIVVVFAPKKEMAERAKALCTQYCPDRVINESQARQLVTSIAANALIGWEKSAVLVRIDYRQDEQGWREIIFHELMHIFCAKLEMGGEHFIDIYGSGHTPGPNPADKAYDGFLNAGHVVWSEFIAQYFALIKTSQKTLQFFEVTDYIFALLGEVTVASDDHSKASFAMACAYLLACGDAGEIFARLEEPDFIWDDSRPSGQEARASFCGCLEQLSGHLQSALPWKITEDFISTLGMQFLMFKIMNSRYFGIME